jgi:hypothetical protein
MKGDPSFFILFGSGHFRSTQTPGTAYLDSLRSHSHGRGNCRFHRPSERDPGFQLLSYVLCNQAGIEFRPLDLTDIYLNLFTGNFLKLFAQQFNLLATLSDNPSGAGGFQRQKNALRRTLNNDVRQTAIFQPCVQIFTQFIVFQ